MSLALDSTHIYYTTTGGAYTIAGKSPTGPGSASGVWQVDKCGGDPVQLATLTSRSGNASNVQVDAAHVYWNDGSTIHRKPLAGGPDEVFASDPTATVWAVLQDENNVYWTTLGAHYDSSLVGRPKAGGQSKTLISALAGVGAVWSSASGVYAWSGASPSLYRVSMTEAPVTLTTTDALEKSCDAEHPSAATTLRTWCQSGFELAPPAIGASLGDHWASGSGVAADGVLYLVENETSRDLYCPLAARLVSLAIASGEQTLLASGLTPDACANSSPTALDEHNVYFTTKEGISGIARR